MALTRTRTRKASSQIHLLHKHFVTCRESSHWGAISLNMEIASLRDPFIAGVFEVTGIYLVRENED